jgi:putative membrane protein
MTGVHALQHTCFLGAALLYWWSLLRPAARGHRGMSMLSLFGTSIHSSLLGALLALSQTAWYPHYRGNGLSFGLSPVEDQQLAGLIMWVPGGLVYVGAALGLLYTILSRSRSIAGDVNTARA